MKGKQTVKRPSYHSNNTPFRFAIVIITNQALRGANAIVEWKKKVPLIGAAASSTIFLSITSLICGM